jgi:predicted porin
MKSGQIPHVEESFSLTLFVSKEGFFMQKKTIALAVAALVSGAAFAQSSVTLYGRADVGYLYSKSDFKKFQGIENGNGIGSGGSRLGFQGEEALGNGLKAVFKFEWGTPIDTGGTTNTGFGTRYSYVGLSGGFGTVTGGRNGTPSDFYLGATAPYGINGHEPINVFRGKQTLLNDIRWNNSIAYASPNFSGLDFMAIYSFGEKVSSSKDDAKGCSRVKGADPIKVFENSKEVGSTVGTPCTDKYYECADTSDAGKLGLGVRYANGPLFLTALYEAQADDDSQKEYGKDSDSGAGAKAWAIGGAYDFKVVKLYANYLREKVDKSVNPDIKQTAWSLGASVPVSSAGTVSFGYAQYKEDDPSGDPKTKGYTVGYRHNLSKRTWLYTYVSHFNNNKYSNAGYGKTTVEGEKQTNFSLGIAHLF